MIVNNKVVNYLGLAMRAGKIVSGEDLCKKELKKKIYFL